LSVAALDDRAVLRIGGADARGYLQDLLTNDVAALTPGRPLYAGLLSAQGKPLFDMILHDGGTAVLVDVLAAHADALAKRLTMYRLRRAVTIEPSAMQVFAAWGDTAAGHPADPRLAALGNRWIGSGKATATTADYHAHRLALGVPDSVDLLPDKMMWLEADAVELNGVSLTKGCYVGQENTARMHHRDRLRKRLLPVHLSGDAATGDEIVADGKPAGELRSHGGGIGIAYLRLEPVEAAVPLTLGGRPVAVAWPSWLPV